MAEKYDDVLLPFLSLMRRELHANSLKGDRPGWLTMDANTALLEVYWHVAKLSTAVKNNDGPAIEEHSADVANMAMMVLDVCGGLAWIAPVQRQPIPVERLRELRSKVRASEECEREHWWVLFARAVERAHGVGSADGPIDALFTAVIDGAMGFGHQNVNRPPDGHWLLRWWKLGRQVAEAAEAENRRSDERQAQLVRHGQELRDAHGVPDAAQPKGGV